MAPKVADLRGMSDEEVIRWHDDLSNQGTSSSFYLDELRRREAERAEAAAYAWLEARTSLPGRLIGWPS
jgi:hypothetical protein